MSRPVGYKPPSRAFRVAARVFVEAQPPRPPGGPDNNPPLYLSEIVGPQAPGFPRTRYVGPPSLLNSVRPYRPARPGEDRAGLLPGPPLGGGERRAARENLLGSCQRSSGTPLSGEDASWGTSTSRCNTKELSKLFIPWCSMYHCMGPHVRVNGISRFPACSQGNERHRRGQSAHPRDLMNPPQRWRQVL